MYDDLLYSAIQVFNAWLILRGWDITFIFCNLFNVEVRCTIYLLYGVSDSDVIWVCLLAVTCVMCVLFRINVYHWNYRAVTLNWSPNFWLCCVAFPRDAARHCANLYIWFMRKMPYLLILKLSFSLLDCMRNLPIIICTKPPIQNDSPTVHLKNIQY